MSGRSQREERDLETLNSSSEYLNAEAAEVLEYQSPRVSLAVRKGETAASGGIVRACGTAPCSRLRPPQTSKR
jgi:hypothetical protein